MYSKKETKLLLNTTLVLFAAFAIVLGQSWKLMQTTNTELTANSVGVFAGVPENEINGLVAQLDEREKALAVREATLVSTQSTPDSKVLMLVLAMGTGLLGLILLNFFLDSKRRNSLAR